MCPVTWVIYSFHRLVLSTDYKSSTFPDVGDTTMNMSDQVPATTPSLPPDPFSSLLCTLEADLHGLYHQSSTASGFLIKLQRIY